MEVSPAEILNTVRREGSEHRVSESECDLCGSHYSCWQCGDVSSDHAEDKIIEALSRLLTQ